ncbi:InlB B-repeat-containing protein [uncultured Senegalimassilia sp.]|uniref:InlB B-repeat-containing protein n=1 Tax=uncultured Senegalimassilia sp. TaxID=1714350 RepID=UPI002613B776|nr:InlB B-repeat-containing protein [uncultured Senegalimassilia sp.]
MLAAAVALVAVPAIAIANSFTVDYSWYKNATGSTYVIKTPGQWNAFANLVNGSADESQAGATADSFKGKTVELGGDLNFFSQDALPVGGQGGRTFDGAFDGKNHEIINVKIDAQGATSNVGLIGAAGEGSSISNVKINKTVSLTIAATDNTKAIENVGVLVGSSKGSISNVSNAGTLTVSHTMDQTRDIVFPIKNVGGVAGICTGDVTGVSNSGAVSVSEPGVPYKADSADADWEDQSILAINIGGIVGSAGDVDSTVDKAAGTAHGTISNCSNTGSVKVDTPKTNGLDRFGNTVYSQSSNVGGIAGYSRGSIDGCTNSGYLDAPHAAGMGGIVGGLRAKTTTTSYSGNFTQEGSDDGMAAGAGALAVTNCTNSGSVYGYSFPAGIVGRAGTYTQISGCINDSAATILGSRATKPFPAGIVGSSYGTVSYCGNLGTIVAGTWTGEGGTITQSGGYFASGIAGNLSSFTKSVDGEQQNASGTPELYGCYNAGAVKAMDNMRQRALVGDNGGYVHDNVAVAGLVYNDRLVYGMYADDTETSGGTVYNNVLLSADDFKANNAYDPAKQDGVSRYNPNTTNAIAVLNVGADKDGWGTYWTKSDGKVNGGNPALNSQVDWPATDLSAATVEFAANAQYTGLAATPKATVTLNGKQLQQDTDFRVVPQKDAVEVTAADSKPYTATVRGIGAYSGEAGSFAYGIDKGDLANCTVTFDTKVFNWTAQEPAATGVHVKNAAGKEIDSSEYTFAFDQSDKNLSNIDASGNATTEDTGKKGAVNAKKYAMVVTAAADSAHFTGKADGTFSIKTAKIAWDKDAEKLKQNAYPTSVSYDGSIISFPKESDTADNIAWDSMTLRADLSPEHQNDGLLTVSYTGKNIKPAVNDVVYKGKSLTLGVDYRVVYGASLNEGQVVEAGKENLGKAGGEGFGYVTARYISGGNFSNYDNMKFKIVDQGEKLNIADAQVKGTDDIVFEQGGVYAPITVWYGGSQLTEGSDYTISYTGNDKLGTASFKIVGTGSYTGEKSGTFKLVEGTPYELQYAFNADGTATVTGVEYNGALDAFGLTIPQTVEHDGKAYTVTAIGDKAFGGLASDFSGSKANESKGKIASVSVPATVKSLGAYAFGASTTGDASMTQLESVTFAEGSQLETIGNFAFAKTGISEIVIPAGVKTIGQNAFSGDNGVLKSVTFMSESGSMPEFATAVASKGSFYGVYGVTAKAYDGTAAAAFAQNMVKSNSWKFVSMGKVPEKAAFTVSFDALGGMPVPEAQTVAKGAAAAKPATDPAKADSTFVGWFESSDGGKTLADSAYDFATPVTADKVLYAKWEEAAEGALVVKVQDADGTVIETKSLSASDLQAMATTDGEPAIGQYAKGGKWNVYRSTNYVTYNDLFANLELSVGAYDVVKACAADGSGKWSGTLGTMNGGAWYPDAESKGSTVNLGAAGQKLPAGLALSYTTGAGDTPAAALAAAESSDAKLDTGKAPLQIMGVCDNTVGGNRFWSNVATVEVTRNAATALTVETQDAEGNVIASKDASYADLLKWKSDGEARGQYYKGGKWNVYRSTDYVTFNDLIANLGLDVSGSDKLFFDKTSPKAWSGTLDAANAGKWYPDAESDTVLGEADGTLPAGIMLAYAKGSDTTVSEALESAQEMGSGSGIVSIMGAWDGATGGNRFWSGLTKLVFQQQISIAKVEGGEGTFGYKQGDIAATVDAKLMSGLTDVSYQWCSVDAAARARVAGTPIEGATSATYELPAGMPAGTYTVYCVVSAKDAKGEAVSVATDPVDLVVAKAPNSIAWVGEGFDASSNSVTVTAQAKPATAVDGETAAAVQYAISSSASADASALAWQDSASFTGLDADSAYYVYAKVSGLPNYEDAVSKPLQVRTKAAGVLASPVLDPVTYDPTATLAGVKLPSGWKWADASTVPTVKRGAYDAVFTPTDEQLASTDYSAVDGWDPATKTVKRLVALTVNKATPVIAAAPSATDLVFGQTLGESSLAGGTASVAGTFAWDDPQRMPQVSESGVACMTVRFAPADADNYNAASVDVAVKVAPKSLAQDVVTITAPGQIYTGAALEPALTVVYNGVTLAVGVDYDAAYANNVEVGTAGYTVTFKGNYAGTASGTFQIAKAPAASVPSDQATGTTGSAGTVATPQTGAAPAAGNATVLAPTGDDVLGGFAAAVCAIVAAAIGAAFARRRMSR